MPRFFVETEPVAGENVLLAGENGRHAARVLRLRVGEKLTLCDGAGGDYRCEVAEQYADAVVVRVLERVASDAEPGVRIRLYQALPKGDKLDFIVQKAVELGACEIVPVLSERCVSRPDAKSMGKKRERLQKIALEAAKQCGRGRVPEILPLVSFREAIAGMKQAGRAILLYEQATAPLSGLLAGEWDDIAVMVGSEGGFSPGEAALAEAEGLALASLGKRILRCETAPLCALTAILYARGEL